MYIIISQSLRKLTSIDWVIPSKYLMLCCPLLLLPSIFHSIRAFSNESALHIKWPNYWTFRFSIRASNEYSRLVSSRIDWLDLLSVQVTLKSLLQHHSSEVSILQCSWSNSSALYGPTLISINDYWKNDSFDLTDICQQSIVSVFLIFCLGLS